MRQVRTAHRAAGAVGAEWLYRYRAPYQRTVWGHRLPPGESRATGSVSRQQRKARNEQAPPHSSGGPSSVCACPPSPRAS